MNFTHVILVICSTLFGLLSIFMLYTKKGNTKANRIIGLFFLVWTLDFFDSALFLNKWYLKNPEFALWTESFVFLYGPLLYFYTDAILKPKGLFKLKHSVHFIPTIIILISTAAFFQTLPRADKIENLKNATDLKQPTGFIFVTIVTYLHFSIYIFWSKVKIKKASKNLNNFYSNYDLSWLQMLLNSFLVVMLISVIISLLQLFKSPYYLKIGIPFLVLAMTLFVLRLILKVFDRPAIQNSTSKYQSPDRPIIDEKEQEKIAAKILEVLQKKSLYSDSELNLNDLSLSIGENKRKVSLVLNDVLGKSFFDLINSYRIEAAQDLLKNSLDKKLTIQEVMYQVGFNSKSSFNTQFKKRTGLTPSEFKRLH